MAREGRENIMCVFALHSVRGETPKADKVLCFGYKFYKIFVLLTGSTLFVIMHA